MSGPTKAEVTRQRILETATNLFSERSYDGVSLRSIARGAAVDPALVHHYFGTKEDLFEAVLGAALDVESAEAELLAGPAEQWGRNLVLEAERLWTSPARTAMLALFRSGIASHPDLLRAFVNRAILSRIRELVPGPPAERQRRASLVGSQLVGLLIARHVIGVEPLASMPIAEVAAAMGPALQHYLTGSHES